MKQLLFILVLLLLAVIAVPLVSAQAFTPNQIITNSEDWEDVYSVELYSALGGTNSQFLVSDRHGPLILNSIPKGSSILILSSAKRPWLVGYSDYVQSKGFTSKEETYPSINLELAKRLSNIKNFIIVDNAYGYNAISVAPYAIISQSFVLFANADNIGDVSDLLGSRTVEKVLVYGHVDRTVIAALATYNPEIINKDGDRFANNVAILTKYQEIAHAKQAILTNGEFIERQIMSGKEPIVFIGSSNVPDIMKEYIKKSGIDIGVLIGNELVSSATTIKRQIGISVFVKFAQGSRAPQGAVNQVEALDMFYLPTYSLNLDLKSIKLNRATGQIEITIQSTVDQAAYFKGTYAIDTSDGQSVTVGDAEAQFINGRETKTMVYDVGNLGGGNITAKVFIIYGESKNALEKTIDKTIMVDVIDVADSCQLELGKDATLNTRSKTLAIDLKNTGPVDCYAQVELVDMIIAGERQTFATDVPLIVQKGTTRQARVKTTLESEDLPDNPLVNLRVRYGEREGSLVRMLEGKLAIVMAKGDLLFYSLIVVIVALILLIIWKRRKNKRGAASL